MNCEVCGRPIVGRPIRIMVERAILTVCPHCAHMGTPVKVAPPPRPKPRRAAVKSLPKNFEVPELVDNYPDLIRSARERWGFSREELAQKVGEKESVIRRLEQGAMEPTLELARKLERVLKISLIIQPKSLEPSSASSSVLPPLTLGDVVVIREKRERHG